MTTIHPAHNAFDPFFVSPAPDTADPAQLQKASALKMERLLTTSSLTIVETSSIMKPEFPLMLEHTTPCLLANSQKLRIPASSILELKKLSRASYKNALQQETAKQRLHLLVKAKEDGLVEILGSADDPVFADPVLTSQIITLRHRLDSILVITNDYDLGRVLLESRTPDSGIIRVCQLNRYGFFSNHPSDRRRDGAAPLPAPEQI